ncbi:response regulator transcription factor [Ideonella livida]|uniref:Response regulator transcription factor n=1 Tax=Ideonella livida TaxID=2707176 RepID=A0A7C9PJV0_9BURK|nr:response regulator transcription factor [Ideonella livida]NDY92852.1 response regulator transcription factor [Ideonella livida]
MPTSAPDSAAPSATTNVTANAPPPAPGEPRPLVWVVEDDEAVSRLVQLALHDFGFLTQPFRTGEAVLRRLRHDRPDLCIVDLGLPDMDGIELVRQIGSQCSAGVLILTGRGHTVDRVMGLELGGDDYMTKPFEPRELVARVRSILRRRAPAGAVASPGGSRRYGHFAGWTLDLAAHLLRAQDGAEHLLGTAEAQVLRHFIERPHQILTREQLMGQRDLSPTDRSIDVRISRLRRKLEQDAQNPKLIKTVYGAGYVFSAAVTWS